MVDTCNWCDQEAEATTQNGENICGDCGYFCERCDDRLSPDDNTYDVDGALWCYRCVQDDASYCDNCDEYTGEGTNYISDRNSYWCDGCTSYNASFCNECDTYYENGCERCDDDSDENGNRVIHDYSYRPDAVFHATSDDERLYFGFELEMEVPYRREGATYACNILEPIDYAYLKNDGSLNSGFELVTHPMSFDFLMDSDSSKEVWETITQLRDKYQARSFHTKTCGFHIHISRTGFTGGAHMHRFLNLVYSNPTFYSKLAGRKSDQWAKFDDVYRHHYDPIQDKHSVIKSLKDKLNWDRRYGNDTDRYSAINTRNAHTLEMRIFKGTMSISAIKAHIQLAHASVEYTRNLTIKDVNAGAYHPDKLVTYVLANYKIYPELIERINSKELSVPMQETTPVGEPDNYPFDSQSNAYYRAERERIWQERILQEEREMQLRIQQELDERRANPTLN